MKNWIGPVATAATAGAIAHFGLLFAAPGVIMDTALDTLEGRGIAEHAFTSPVRINPQSQAVVRSSPDLFYSLCRYDLSEEGSYLSVTMAEWPGYQSLSLFDSETNNFVTYRGTNEAIEIRLDRPGTSPTDGNAVASPTARGVALIRRLAPTQELFDRALQVSELDRCQLMAD